MARRLAREEVVASFIPGPSLMRPFGSCYCTAARLTWLHRVVQDFGSIVPATCTCDEIAAHVCFGAISGHAPVLAMSVAFPIYAHRKRHGDEALKRIVREMAEATGIEAYLRQQQAILSRPDSRPRLAAISCPTLVLVGEGDEATPPELAREIAEGIRGSRLVVVPDSGHLSTLEQPAMVTKALVEWLKS
jgi:pimeloyl-ACP methyl ester carboxylesterase